MTTHPRARAFQAGAFLAVIGGSLVVAPTPALAKAPSVVITSFSPSNLKGGERATLKYRVTNTNGLLPEADDTVSVTVSVSPGELRCEGDCSASEPIAAGQSRDYTVTLVAGTMPSGASKNGSVVIKATLGGQSSSSSRSVTVRGDDKPPTAKLISGKVRDQAGKAVKSAEVYMVDSQQHQYETKSNGSGSFKFFSSDQQPISPGSVTVGARKEGFVLATATGSVAANGSAKIDIVLTSTATPSASPSTSVSASASPSATEQPPAEEDPAAEDTPEVPAVQSTKVAQSSDSSSTLFLVLGGLLVAAGIGAIVLVMMRRRTADPDADPTPDAPAPRPAGAPVPAQSRNGADATRVAGSDATRVAGAGAHPAEATMVTTAPLPPSLSEAPTMLQQAVPPEDEFPDPYGAPAVVAHAGYAPPRPSPRPATPPRPAATPAGTYGAPAVPVVRGAAGQPTNGVGPVAVPYTAPPGGAPAGKPYGQPPPGQPLLGQPTTGQATTGQATTGQPANGRPAPGRPTPDRAVPVGGATMAAGYGAGAPQQRYDEPTGMYRPQADVAAAAPGHQQPAGYPAAGQSDGHYAADDGYDQGGYDQGGYDQGGYAPAERVRGGHQQPGHQPGHERPGYDQPGYQQPSYEQPGYDQPAYDQPGYDQTGYDQAGYEQADYDQAGYGHAGFEQAGYAAGAEHAQDPGYDHAGYAPAGQPGHAGYGQPEAYRAGSHDAYPQQAAYQAGAGYPETEPQYASWSPGAGSTAGHAAPAYDEPTGYDPNAGYGHPPQETDPHVEYDTPGGYYDAEQPVAPQGGRHGAPPTAPPQRRQLDWLDD